MSKLSSHTKNRLKEIEKLKALSKNNSISLNFDTKNQADHMIYILESHIDYVLKPEGDEFLYEIKEVESWIEQLKVQIS